MPKGDAVLQKTRGTQGEPHWPLEQNGFLTWEGDWHGDSSLGFLTDVFSKMNEESPSLQGEQRAAFIANKKIQASKQKFKFQRTSIHRWIWRLPKTILIGSIDGDVNEYVFIACDETCQHLEDFREPISSKWPTHEDVISCKGQIFIRSSRKDQLLVE